jgi:cell division protein FtsW
MSDIYRHIELVDEMKNDDLFTKYFRGFDLAGDESKRNPAELRNAFLAVMESCSNITIHAGETVKAKNYQVNQAKAAIVHGGITGMGPGKSALKQMLPQSASDFIFAIIVEEYGFFGAFALITLYMIMMIRIVMIASKMRAFFGSLLVLSLGIMIFVQLAVNIAVAVNLIPVTGQPLPLISYGGTSMLVTYLQLGIILNVSSRILTFEEEGMGKKQNVEEINDIA